MRSGVVELEKERLVFDLPIQMFMHARATPAIDRLMISLSRAASAWIAVPFDVLVAAVLVARGRCRHDAAADDHVSAAEVIGRLWTRTS